MRSSMTSFTLIIAIFYAVGLLVLGGGLYSMVRSNAAAKWPVALGVIDHVELTNSTDSEGGTTYRVDVGYSYHAMGSLYRNDTLAFGYAGSSGYGFHNDIYKKLMSVDEVDVRYDPADPQNSTLSYGMHRTIKFFIIFGFIWLAFTIGFHLLLTMSNSSVNVLLKNLVTH